jgi:hypothetical protein
MKQAEETINLIRKENRLPPVWCFHNNLYNNGPTWS